MMATAVVPHSLSPSDFLFGPIIGEGRFGTVVYAERRVIANTNTQAQEEGVFGNGYAIKMIPKSEILRHNQLHVVLTEKRILSEILFQSNGDDESSSSAGTAAPASMIPKLFCCFHDDSYLYFVLELCTGGTMVDLFNYCGKLKKRGGSRSRSNDSSLFMDKTWIKYYAGQLIRVMEFIHQKGVVHRDFSPKNILFSSKGELKLCDFGSAVFISSSPTRSSVRIGDDFVGTADYMCPEMIRGSNTHNGQGDRRQELLAGIDLWSFGCIVFQMSTGESPFHAKSDQGAFQGVLYYAQHQNSIHFPSHIDTDLKDLISSLLVIDVSCRIGISDQVTCSWDSQKFYHSLRKHQFFQDNRQAFWDLLENKLLDPPYHPCEQPWMTQLYENKGRLRQLDEMHFDL